ncbi:MAG: hypothetical protein LBC82_08165 [Oscillospiraceae bacterium]|jgi:rRNA maturation endonuclease Nob1|nr:hypothetical protein [Oscillospiraceae bacterium]
MGFIKPAWASENGKRALKAVEKETTQTILAEIAKNAPLSHTRKNALDKLTDQVILADIAKNAPLSHTRKNALDKLTDQVILADIAKNDKESGIRKVAVAKLTDQAVLTDLAENATSIDMKMEAAEKLENKIIAYNVFKDIAENPKAWGKLRITATEKLTDQILVQKILIDIAKKSYGNADNWGYAALEKLSGEEIIADVAKEAIDNDISDKAIKKLVNENILQNVFVHIANNNKKTNERRVAMVEKINNKDIGQQIIADIIINATSNAVYIPIDKLTNESALTNVANNSKIDFIRIKACEKIGHIYEGECFCTRCGKEEHYFENDKCLHCGAVICHEEVEVPYCSGCAYDMSSSGASGMMTGTCTGGCNTIEVKTYIEYTDGRKKQIK